MNKDLKHLIWSFIIITLLSNGLYVYFAKSYFKGICKIAENIESPCTYFEYIREPIMVFTLIWFAIFLIIFLIILFTRKLNKYGFYVPDDYKYPLIIGPLALYRFFRALKRWAKNEPTDYPSEDDD